nr:T9SS type A sorting domain-containing protein [Fodinibius sp.]NIV10181.1 T9SS type A sorting domain-containing protein [Fodinibius sp.]NIY23796.1 T9SS type A sorting domain-containing protein [Fodinibius sp.]
MRKIIILWLALLLPPALFAQTMTDTLWSVPQLDGEIAFRPVSGIFNMTTSSLGFYPGDGWDWFLGEEAFSRAFLCFDLQNLSISDTTSIINATIGIYQLRAIGNDQIGVYPIWNVPGGDTLFCILDHIDYGNSLDLGDFTAGDPGDPQTLETNIGIISDSAGVGYKTIDVTPYLKVDIANERIYNQYRMRFPIDLDYDSLADGLDFRSGNSSVTRPYLTIHFDSMTSINNPIALQRTFELLQNFPNPFNAVTKIRYRLNKGGIVRLDLYDIAGRLVKNLINSYKLTGEHVLTIDAGDLPSGVYYYRMKLGRQA